MFFLDNLMKVAKPRYDDDSIDRLNYYYTAVILIVFSLTLSAKQYVGQPLQCWVPAQFTGAWEQYTENYCYVQNTYFLPIHDDVPKSFKERDEREIGYYQWVPFVLAFEAILFFLPCLFWRLLNWQSGINVKAIIKMAVDTENVQNEKREKNVQTVAAHIHDALDLQRDLKGRGRLCSFLYYGKHYGSYVTGLYVLVKLLFLINVVGQFFLLNSFLGFPTYSWWGFEVLAKLSNGHEWEESGHFPRVNLCDFEVRVLGNLHRYTVQCVLMVNMFNEKIFLFLWWWFFLVAILTFLSFAYWLIIAIAPSSSRDFVTRYLRVRNAISDSPSDKRLVNRFVTNCLRPDGIFLMRLISSNAGDILSTDLTEALWDQYKEKELASAPPPPSLTEKEGFKEEHYPTKPPSSLLPRPSSGNSSPRAL